jgi:hypothetical protein
VDAVTLALAKKHTNEQVIQKATNSPTETISFDCGAYSLPSTVVNGQVSDCRILGRTYTNLIKNGSFENGSNNWNNISGMISIDTTKSYTGLKSVKQDLIDSAVGPSQNINLIDGHKYYFSSMIYISSFTSGNPRMRLANQSINIYASTSILNQWQRLSVVIENTVSSEILSFSIPNNGTFTAFIDAVIGINLTQTFGAGKEPTKEQCDQIFTNWFDGTKSTNSVRLRSVNSDETKESIAYVNLPPGEVLRSLPNGTKDEFNASTGVKTQRVKKYVLQASDIAINTSLSNLDVIGISASNVTDWVYSGIISSNRQVGSTVYGNFVDTMTTDYDKTKNIGKNLMRFLGTNYILGLGVDKNKYISLAEAQADLAGTTLIYQLAKPIVTDIPKQKLEVFENGTVYVEPMGDPAESTVPSVEMTIPTGTSNKFGVATHDYGGAAADWVLTNSESKCFLLAVSNADGAANIIAPDAPGVMYAISNASGHTITIKISGGAGGAGVADSKTVLVIHNGTDYTALTAEL